MTLLSSFGKRGAIFGLNTIPIDVEDIKQSSKYFDVTEFTPVFTAGKNSVSFNGSQLLAAKSEIKIECLDSNYNSLYIEIPDISAHYSDMAKFTVSVSIFADTKSGPGLFILVGTLSDGRTVRWKANITINNSLPNQSRVRFYNTPTLEVNPLLYPVIQSNTGSLLTTTSSFITSPITDVVTGTPISPAINTRVTATPFANVDYRITIKAGTNYFGSQMEGKNVILNVKKTHVLGTVQKTNITRSVKIQKVMDNTTLQLAQPFWCFVEKAIVNNVWMQGNFVCNIYDATIEIDYAHTSYTTQSNAYETSPTSSLVMKSYADVLYRNIKTFSGAVFRQKLYARSEIYPGEFEIISDTIIGSKEHLTDPITVNKSYSSMGIFINQDQIAQYWFTSSNALQLSQSGYPFLNSMYITAPNYTEANGNNYVIAKATSFKLTNDAKYYPYKKTDFDSLSGTGYTSNFIDLKQDTLYALSTNLVIQKNTTDAKVSFYLSSSISSVNTEKNFKNQHGILLGEIVVSDNTTWKLFDGIQTMFFTPNNDYYGTLVIVPYHCNVVLANLSLQNYGDYGFSTDTGRIRIPFPINVGNEKFAIKAELYDINSNLVYSNLQTTQLFDPGGLSLYGSNILGTTGMGLPSELPVLTIDGNLYLPNVSTCVGSNTNRILGINLTNGAICATNIVSLRMISSPSTNTYKDYIELNTVNPTLNGRSLIVHYSGSVSEGKRIVILANGTKTIYS